MTKKEKQEVLDLQSVKELIRQKNAEDVQLSEKDIMELAEKNHLSEEEEDELFAWCQENDMYVLNNEDELLEEEGEEEAEEEPAAPEMSPNDRKFMDKLMELMEKNLDNGDMVVDDLVRELAVSRSVFFKKLKTLTGLAPVEFIKEVRINHAIRLIETGEYSMTQISYMVGINDPRYFSKCFKQKMGMTPTEYRDKHKRK